MKIMNICTIILVFVGLMSSLGCIDLSDNKVETTSTEPLTQVPPASFEDQIRVEIENKNNTGVASVSYWIDGTNITYHKHSKTLLVEIVVESYWSAKYLNTLFFDATFDIMEVAVKHPDKIVNVTIVGKATTMDTQGHESISEVYRVNTTMDNAENVNWENLQLYGRYSDPESTLRNNFNYVKIHPLLYGVGVY